MTLAADEFVRRFLLHVLPAGFHRIRHYGVLANPSRRENLLKIRELLGVVPANIGHSANDVLTVAVPPTFVCWDCGSPMIIIDILQRSRPIRAPPVERTQA
ncbi:Putative transposase (plasmid) [Caballeronia sp. SBC2]|nr:Putative transposase [Caballeronia sp. SBC2]